MGNFSGKQSKLERIAGDELPDSELPLEITVGYRLKVIKNYLGRLSTKTSFFWKGKVKIL